MQDGSRYFCALDEAAGPDAQKQQLQSIAQKLQDVVVDFTYDRAATAYEHLHQDSFRFGSSSEVRRAGDKGELVKIRANKAKALLKSWVGLMLGAPMTWRPSARNDDVECRAAVKSTADVMEYFAKERGLDVFVGEWVEAGCAFEEAYALVSWDATKGNQVGIDFGTGSSVWTGGLWVRLVQKWDAFYDKSYRSWQDAPWICLRTYENRHDLAALETDEQRKQAILDSTDWLRPMGGTFSTLRRKGNDVVPVYNFFHRPSPAMPDGLALRFVSSEAQVGEALPCKRIPAIRFSPAAKLDSTEGDSQWLGTLGLQQMRDSVNSSLATNLDAFATQAIEMPADIGISTDHVNNVKAFERPKGMPPGQVQPIQLVRQPEGAADILEMWASDMLDIVGLNDVSQGSPDSAQMNAAAFAILKSASTERNSQSQKRALGAYSQLGGLILYTLSENMTEEDFIVIAGRDAQAKYPSQRVGKSKLGLVESVYIEVGSALEQSVEGRMQMTDYGIKVGALKDARGVVSVIRTGRFPEEMNRVADEQLLIQWENDEILAGRVPTVFFTHDHMTHGPGHACVGLNPMALQTDATLKAAKAHLDWHYAQFYGLPEGTPPESDPMYADRLRVLLGQTAPGQVGPPPMGDPSGTQPPMPGETSGSAPGVSNQPTGKEMTPPNGAPPALSPPKSPEGDEEMPSEIPSVLQ